MDLDVQGSGTQDDSESDSDHEQRPGGRDCPGKEERPASGETQS